VRALDAAAQLAADANAAAAALENLRRLLTQRLPDDAAARAGATAVAAATATPPHLPDRTRRSAHEPVSMGATASLPPMSIASSLPLPVPQSAERGPLDVRGFLAGIALSWAIGVMLYLFMIAG
jgi:hypothetical protein